MSTMCEDSKWCELWHHLVECADTHAVLYINVCLAWWQFCKTLP